MTQFTLFLPLMTNLATTTPVDPEVGMSWLELIQRGGVVGWILFGLSFVAVALIIMHFVQIRRSVLIAPGHLERLDDMLSRGDVNGGLEYCLDPAHNAYLTRIMSAGLLRYQKSAFGAFEFKNAIEEAAEEQTARLYRSTDALGVIGSTAPLLGLLGTVLGMIGAFDSLAKTAGSNHEQLASHIGLALVTTLMGLILAIPCIALFTFFRNRIDALGAEAAAEIERLTLHLETVQPAQRGRPPARTPQRPGASAGNGGGTGQGSVPGAPSR